MPEVIAERLAPVKTIISRDGEASIQVIPVQHNGMIVSYYVKTTQAGKHGVGQNIAEINLSVEQAMSYVNFISIASNF